MTEPIKLEPPEAARLVLTSLLADVLADLLNNRLDARKFQLMTNIVSGLSGVPSEGVEPDANQASLW